MGTAGGAPSFPVLGGHGDIRTQQPEHSPELPQGQVGQNSDKEVPQGRTSDPVVPKGPCEGSDVRMKTWKAPETHVTTSRDAQPYEATSVPSSLSPAAPTGLSLQYKEEDAGFKPCQHSQPHYPSPTSARLFALGETASPTQWNPKDRHGVRVVAP